MPLVIEKSKDNLPIPVINGLSLHSRYEPFKEGETLAHNFLRSFSVLPKKIIVYGLGFGYHILPLLYKFEKIVVVEPDEETRREAEKLPHLLPVFEECEIITGRDYPETLPVFCLPVTKRLYGDFCKATKKINLRQPTQAVCFKGLKVLVDYPVFGGSSTTAVYVTKAFEQLGLQVKIVDNSVFEPFYEQLLNRPKESLLAEKLIDLCSTWFYEEYRNFNPDLCFFNAQSPVNEHLMKLLSRSKCPCVFWFVEDYRRFSYWQDVASWFDLFCVIQKEPFGQYLTEKGATPVYLPLACAPEIQQKIALSASEKECFGSDLSFMGAGYPNRHALLEALTGYNLKIWGTGFEQNSLLTPFLQKEGARVTIEETVKIYNATKININLHSSLTGGYFEEVPDFVNPRTFEICACGGFQLVDARILLPELLTPGEDLITFTSVADLKEKIDFYLSHPELREKIARSGQKKVLAEHTYAQRLQFLLLFLYENTPSFRDKISEKQGAYAVLQAQISEPEFKEVIENFGRFPALPELLESIRKQEKPLRDYEAILLMINEITGQNK